MTRRIVRKAWDMVAAIAVAGASAFAFFPVDGCDKPGMQVIQPATLNVDGGGPGTEPITWG